MSKTRLLSSVVMTCAAFAVALPGCTSDQTGGGVGDVEMAVTLATPPAGPNEQINEVDVSFWCDGMDPVLGSPRPPMDNPELITINTSTSQGAEPKNTIGLFEKQGLPAGNCHFSFTASSTSGATDCTGEITLAVQTNMTTPGEVILNCIHTPRYGGVRVDGTFNQCAEYRQILVSPTTQAIGNLVDVRTEVYDPDGDDVTVFVQAVGDCGNVNTIGSPEAPSCETVSGCEAVVNTVECTGVGLCEIIVTVSDDYDMGNGPFNCNGLLPDGSNNDGARQTIAVDCTVASGCGNGVIEPGEDCEPPNTPFCDGNCQDIDNCVPDPCDQTDACNPEVCSGDPVDNTPVCTADPASALGNMCSPPAGGTCDGAGNCVACTLDTDCDDSNECTDNACVAGACVFTNDDTNTCTIDGNAGTCNAGVCEGLCTGVTCPDNGIECVTDTCNPGNGLCDTPVNDGINTGCTLAGGGAGVCTGAGSCVECNIDGQCGAGEECVSNACQPAGPQTITSDLTESVFVAYNTLLPFNPGVCDDPDLNGGNTQCVKVIAPDIRGTITLTPTGGTAWAVHVEQTLNSTIPARLDAFNADVIINADSLTVLDGTGDGSVPGTITLDTFDDPPVGTQNMVVDTTFPGAGGTAQCLAVVATGAGAACNLTGGCPDPLVPCTECLNAGNGQTCGNLVANECDPVDASGPLTNPLAVCNLAGLPITSCTQWPFNGLALEDSGCFYDLPTDDDNLARLLPNIVVTATNVQLDGGPAVAGGYYRANEYDPSSGPQWIALAGVQQ